MCLFPSPHPLCDFASVPFFLSGNMMVEKAFSIDFITYVYIKQKCGEMKSNAGFLRYVSA